MSTRSSIAIPAAAVLACAFACGGSPPAAREPSQAPVAPVPAVDGPPMYRPSSRSPAPVSIVDPAYGAFSGAPDAPGMGATLPDFEVALADGGSFSLKDARRAGPVLVMFYRGFW